ncbi:hypothetical protein M5K25_007853 [Dendrobium thyrsiflorum]|uniref:Uncharacterized protein n=1 Tax=Dendrobium thyrsiflorum TaxID=117978 RepID=A0ABD0VGD3_DENTH
MRGYMVTGEHLGDDSNYVVHQFLQWYKSWATLYMLKALVEPPTTSYPRAPSERLLRDFLLGTKRALQHNFNGTEDTQKQCDINTVAKLYRGLCWQIHIDD